MRQSVAIAFLSVLLCATSVDAAEQFSREVGKPLQAAQAETKKGRWDAAMALLKEADAVRTKSAYEQYQINEMKAFVYSRQKNMAGVAEAYEANLASGRTPAAQVGPRLKTLAQIYAGQRSHQKAIEYTRRWINEGGGKSDPQAYQLLANTHYLAKDYRNSAKSIQDGIVLLQRANKKVPEEWINLRMNSFYALKDDKGVMQTREQLVRLYPKRENWEVLLDMRARQIDDDVAKLNLYRLMLDLGVLKRPNDFVEMAQMMMDEEFSVPAEAVHVIQRGLDNKALSESDRRRQERVLTAATERAAAARQKLADMEQAAQAAGTGEADVRLGAVYMSFGDSARAVTAIERGIRKGSLQNPDHAHMLLGLANFRAGQKDQARKAFALIPAKSKLATVADLWVIRVQQTS